MPGPFPSATQAAVDITHLKQAPVLTGGGPIFPLCCTALSGFMKQKQPMVYLLCARHLLGIPYPLHREDIRQGAEE